MTLNIVTLGSRNAGILREDLTLRPDENPANIRIYHKPMADLCRTKGGIGLAANQVGLRLKLFYVAANAKVPTLMGGGLVINPSYEPVGDPTSVSYEGCLSIPGKSFSVARYGEILARWTNIHGHRFEQKLKNLAARVFQHEYDHLRGILISDKEVSK
jgi:peptide deformylase